MRIYTELTPCRGSYTSANIVIIVKISKDLLSFGGTVCCTTYFHPNHPFHPKKHHLNPIFSAPYRQVLSQKRAKSMLFLPIPASFCPKTCNAIFISQYSTHYIKPFLSSSTDTSDVDDEAYLDIADKHTLLQ